jgi:putative DNA primase/helicase
MPIGTQEQPFASVEPIKLAQTLFDEKFRSPDGGKGLVWFKGNWFRWYGEKWVPQSKTDIEHSLWEWFRTDRYVLGENGPDPYTMNNHKMANLMSALAAIARTSQTKAPCWLRRTKKEMPDTDYLIPFEDVILDVKTRETYRRDSNWFGSVVLPCQWEPAASYPRWARCLDEWSAGDEVWKKLLQRWFGYCLVRNRRYHKWLLMQGKTQAGKSVISNVMGALLGDDACPELTMSDLASQFGLGALEHAQVVTIPEFHHMAAASSARAVSVIKCIVGEDALTLDIKYREPLKNVRVKAAPMMHSNMMPKMPNHAKALSSKMLVLPFDVSFKDHPQEDLLDELLGELPGITAWAATGAMELEQETDITKKFVMPDRALETIHVFHLTNNPFDFFLEARFIETPMGRVANQVIWREWNDWLKKTQTKIHVPVNQLSLRLVSESSWDLSRSKTGGTRFLKGLSLKKAQDDHV